MDAIIIANDVTNARIYLPHLSKTLVRKCHSIVLDLTFITIVPNTIVRLIICHPSVPVRKLDPNIPMEHTFIPNTRMLYFAILILRLRRQCHLPFKQTLHSCPCHQEMCHFPEACHPIPLMLLYPKPTLVLSTLIHPTNPTPILLALVLVDLIGVQANLDFTLLLPNLDFIPTTTTPIELPFLADSNL